MRIAYFPNQTASGSEPVWKAFLESCQRKGIELVENAYNADAAIIWSVLWNGRMIRNQQVWRSYRDANKPVVVIEVGVLDRGNLWKVGVNGINGTAYFGPKGMSDERRNKLKIKLSPWRRSQNIIICIQHALSQQWDNMPNTDLWLEDTITQIRNVTDRKIIIRTHPRFQHRPKKVFANTVVEYPRSVVGIADSINFEKTLNSASVVINWNSNPAVLAAIKGVPVFVGPSSLAAPVGNFDLSMIENPSMPDREQWINDLAYTEWSVDEISKGEPLDRIYSMLTSRP